jgi:hypothetical protein
MEKRVGKQGDETSVVGPGTDDEDFVSTCGRDLQAGCFQPLPIIEISDKDYRSFCWPCYALEETGDDKPGDLPSRCSV